MTPADALADALADAPATPLCVGLSGGLDSTVLLHALAASPAARHRGLRALNVDHGLHAQSPAWAAHCRALCKRLGVPLHVQPVHVGSSVGSGLEAAAREARYAAFAHVLATGETLVLGHHRDDQVETLLLRLLRGSGTAALAGMARLRPLARGQLWRPLLALPRTLLHDYARHAGLQWIEDPANADPRHDRSVLRHELLPRLRARWPGADAALARSARLLGEDGERLHRVDAQLLAGVQGFDPATLSLPAFTALEASERRAVLRAWLKVLVLPPPPAAVIDRIDHELLGARDDAAPCLRWAGAELRRYRESLHAMAPLPNPARGWRLRWDGRDALPLPTGFGTLCLEGAGRAGFGEPVEVRPRDGGERMQCRTGARRQALKHVLQELGVPPWWRQRLPLLFDRSGELVAAGDLVVAPAWQDSLGDARLRWASPLHVH